MKSFKDISKGFSSDSILSLRNSTTVVVVYNNGNYREYYNIEKPWPYIRKIKKNPQVKTAYLK